MIYNSLRHLLLALTLCASASVMLCPAQSHRAIESYSGAPRWAAPSTPIQVTAQMPEVPFRAISFDTTEGTYMNVDVSPDGETLIFDLLGDIYELPIGGGEAITLTAGRAWDQAPRFSPDGAHIYFVSDRDRYKNIWRLTLADQTLQQVTQSDSDIVGGPNWSQDGSHLLVGRSDPRTPNSEFILHSVDPNTGNMTPINAPGGPWIDLDTFKSLRPAIHIFSAVESATGTVIFSQAERDRSRNAVRLYAFDIQSQTRTAITPRNASYSDYKPQLSHDGRLLAYFRQYNDRRTELRILARTTGQDDPLIELSNADDAYYIFSEDARPNYAFTPDNRQLVFWHDGRIHRVNISDGSSVVVPFRVNVERKVWARVEPTVQHLSDRGEAKIIRWPSLSRDGRTMAFAAIGYVWVMDVESGQIRRVTDSSDLEYMPALSPDGKSIAYVSFAQSGNDYGPGRLVVVDVDDGALREVLASPDGTYLLPKWSPDSSKIALIREVEYENGLEAAFGWTAAATGKFQEVAPAPASNDLASLYIYARYVCFDETGDNLLISFPRSKKETVLVAVPLDGSTQRTIANGTSEVGGITPAPDLKSLALTRDDGTVWILPFEVGKESVDVSTTSSDARRVSEGGGYYVDWTGPSHLTYGFGQSVYRYRLDPGKLEALRVKVTFDKPKAVQPIAFTGARIVAMSDDFGLGGVIESGTIVVDARRIAAIGPAEDVAIPSDSLVIDVTGKTIMPGLLDVHYHRIGGFNLSAFALPNSDFSDQSAIAYGVTTAWEPGASPNDGVPATVDLQRAGRILGPRWSHSGKGAVGSPFELLTTYAAALSAVRQHQGLGVTVLKEYNTPIRRQRQWLSAAARYQGMGIISHLQSFDGMMTRIVDGYTGGDHPHIPVPFYKDVQELLRQTGYVWTPNITITSGTVGGRLGKRYYFCQAVFEWRERTGSRGPEARSICPSDQGSAVVPYEILRFSRIARQAALAASDGVHIGVSAHGMPGSMLHREMWFLWKGGMTIEDVLRAATIGNAKKLGLQGEVGSLEPGKIADFLVLDENPLDDILNTLSLKYTVQGGVVYASDTALPAEINSIRDNHAAPL